MIAAQEKTTAPSTEEDGKTAEVQRLAIKKTEIDQQIAEAIKLIDAGKLPKILKMIKGREELQNGIIRHYNTIGRQNREAKNFAEAVKNYDRAISVSPQDENLHYNTARAYFEEGRQEKALEFLERALKLNPEFKEGKTFHEYLLERSQAQAGGTGEKPAGGSFKALFVKNVNFFHSIAKRFSPGRTMSNS